MSLRIEQRRECPEWLANLDLPTPEALERMQFPLPEVLQHSLYYPASGTDGRPVQFLAGFVHSFIYADYGVGEEELRSSVELGFLGYRVMGRKRLSQDDLAPSGWQPQIPDQYRREAVKKSNLVRDFIREPFAEWLIFEREPDRGEEHGPERFSLVYIGADGVAGYQALYLANRTAPAVLAIIQPGTGFGGNYTDFRDPNGFLASTVLRGRGPVPEYLVCGGMGRDYTEAFWPDDYPNHVEWFQHINGNGVWQHREKSLGSDARV